MKYTRPQELPTHRASGTERLDQLARFLDTLPAGMLTFSKWYGDGRGCAVGLAADGDPWFRAQGLALLHDERLKDCQPVFEGRKDWCAVVAFFGISHAEARELFSPEGYGGDIRPDPKRIAAKIRRRLARQKRRLTEVETV